MTLVLRLGFSSNYDFNQLFFVLNEKAISPQNNEYRELIKGDLIYFYPNEKELINFIIIQMKILNFWQFQLWTKRILQNTLTQIKYMFERVKRYIVNL